MSEDNKAVARRFYEEMINEGNVDLAEELFASDHVLHDPAMPEEVRGLEGIKQYVSMYISTYPDLNVVVEDQVAEGDKVVTRYTARGAHQGELMGIEPTGRRVEVPGIQIQRFDEEGKIVEDWNYYDALGMLRQLGALEQRSAE